MILDTHALLWLDRDDPAIGQVTRRQIEAAWRVGTVAVSAISFWEAAMLAERERITLLVSIDRWRSDWLQAGLVEVPLDGRIALASCRLENFHRDPVDRFIVATALDRPATLDTATPGCLTYYMVGVLHRSRPEEKTMSAHSRHGAVGHTRPVYFISSRPEAYEVAGEVDLERARELAHTIADRAARRYPTVEFRIDDQWHLHDEQLTGVANYIESHWERWARAPKRHH